ncbi:MAG TPA: hypothetical protein VGG13_03045 [Candidatus Saccharimonadales bacterium]
MKTTFAERHIAAENPSAEGVKSSERGQMNVLLVPLILVSLVLIGVAYFGYWAYEGRQDYKNNVDQKVAAATQVSNQQLTVKLNAQFAQEEKNPLKTYAGPSPFGSVQFKYPKTWSAYVDVDSTSDTPVDGYFYPDVVPATGADDTSTSSTNFALRIQVLEQDYSTTLQNYQSQGGVTINPFRMPKVPSVVGVMITGQIQSSKTGTLIVLPLRTATLEVWTESPQFLQDLTKTILPSFTFSP